MRGVVFLGDQVTERWGEGTAAFFPGRSFLNRGIDGQTSAQMLVRFHQDVVALKPKVVVIQAGVNDLLRIRDRGNAAIVEDDQIFDLGFPHSRQHFLRLS